ncbi:cytochrome P450 [Oceaniglobus roseus]|uniref:cytochrome P450 n=1 Tax=Oceaniglobus roseus TaxID=1737570 RepID=UPI000C7F7779|nr:cytochrome P450 [Kandeliimicrobium roseum]
MTSAAPDPHAPDPHTLDAALGLYRDPYGWIGGTARDLGTEIFEARLLLTRTTFVTGPEAARFFYGPDLQRDGAAPGFLEKGLFGEGGVQGLDGEAHRRRKRMFLDLVGPSRVEGLIAHVRRELDDLAGRAPGLCVVQDEMERLLTKAVCAWADVPLPPEEIAERAETLSDLFEHAAPTGLGHLKARRARTEADAWIRGLVEAVRRGELAPAEGSALAVVSAAQDAEGGLLPPKVAAVELLNILRPTVAISAFVTFAAHALHHHPQHAAALAEDDEAARSFVQEVRRHYPFFPAAAALTRRDTTFAGVAIPEGRRVLLDLYGTNHDPATWDSPGTFRPDRFRDWPGDPFTLIPQGGGDHATGHRCPGEWFTIAVMEETLKWLVRDVTFEVPEQALALDMQSLPALPESRMALHNIRRRRA